MQGVRVAQKIALFETRPDGFLAGEVAIGRTLIRRIGRNEYPFCLSRLIGYNPGIPEDSNSAEEPNRPISPIALPSAVFTYQPHSLSDIADQLPVEPRRFWEIADGLIIALCYLQASQVVHRHIRLETVRWDGSDGATVQLADFSYAVPEWELDPRPVGEVPWDAPEARGAAVSADCRDDVYAVAMLLALLATGQEFTDDAEASEAIARLDMGQRSLLSKATAARRRDRPTASELRRLRRLPDPLNPVLRGDQARESEARARFTELRRRQEAANRRQAPRDNTRAGPRPQAGRAPDDHSAAGPAQREAPVQFGFVPLPQRRWRRFPVMVGGLLLLLVAGLMIMLAGGL